MKYIIITIMLILTVTLNSYSILEKIEGNFVGNLDARSVAMGSASTAEAANLLAVRQNPANLSLLKGIFGTQLTGNFIFISENRTLPMYNSFDAYADDATYANNTNLFDNFAGGVFGNLRLMENKFSLAFLYHTFIDFTSNYDEEVRNNANSDYDNYPPILAKNLIEGSGSIDALSFLAAYQYDEIFSLGFKLSKLQGNSDWERKVVWSDHSLDIIPDLQDQENELERDFDGFLFQTGMNITISPRLNLGFSFSPKTELDVTGKIDTLDVAEATYLATEYYPIYNDSTNALEGYDIVDSLTYADYTIPMKIRSGINYAPRNIMRTNFALDLEYVSWSDMNPLFDDVYNFYLGVEHKLENSIPLRFGFSHQTKFAIRSDDNKNYANKIFMPTFSAGTGFSFLENFVCDISLEYTNRKYEALDLFPDSYYDYDDLWENPQYLNFSDRGWENPDMVKESLLKLKTSISYRW